MKCQECENQLTGKQEKFCSSKCRVAYWMAHTQPGARQAVHDHPPGRDYRAFAGTGPGSCQSAGDEARMSYSTLLPHESDADACRRLGFKPGTRIVGNEGYGNTIIEITAIGEKCILARQISHDGMIMHGPESTWTLSCRRWVEVPKK